MNKKMTKEEKSELLAKMNAAATAGDWELLETLGSQYPVPSWMAENILSFCGVNELKRLDLNLAEAEGIYGSDWVR